MGISSVGSSTVRAERALLARYDIVRSRRFGRGGAAGRVLAPGSQLDADQPGS